MNDASKATADPIRRWTYIVALALVVIIGLNIAFDRLAPITFQATAETLVVPVAPQVSGELIEVPVKDNSRVEAGQLLAVVDPTAYKIALESARASYGSAQQAVGAAAAAVDSARAVVISRRAQLVQAQQDNGRTAILVDRGYATRAKLEVTMATLASAEAGVVQAEAQLPARCSNWGRRATPTPSCAPPSPRSIRRRRTSNGPASPRRWAVTSPICRSAMAPTPAPARR